MLLNETTDTVRLAHYNIRFLGYHQPIEIDFGWQRSCLSSPCVFPSFAPWKAQMAWKSTQKTSVLSNYRYSTCSKNMQICLLWIAFQWCVKTVDLYAIGILNVWVRTASRRGAIIMRGRVNKVSFYSRNPGRFFIPLTFITASTYSFSLNISRVSSWYNMCCTQLDPIYSREKKLDGEDSQPSKALKIHTVCEPHIYETSKNDWRRQSIISRFYYI